MTDVKRQFRSVIKSYLYYVVLFTAVVGLRQYVFALDFPGKYYVKRGIGLLGDTIAYKNDRLYINDKEYDEPYLKQYKRN